MGLNAPPRSIFVSVANKSLINQQNFVIKKDMLCKLVYGLLPSRRVPLRNDLMKVFQVVSVANIFKNAVFSSVSIPFIISILHFA